MTLSNTAKNKINSLAAQITSLVSTHAGITGSSSTKGHVQAGGTPQAIGNSLSAGTDNGYYARADHVHTVSYSNISGTPTIADNLSTNDATQVLSAKQGKILNDLIGDAISYINQ